MNRFLETKVSTLQSYQYEYHLKDLPIDIGIGNIRLSFTDKNNDGLINNQTEILQDNGFYPFGMALTGAWYDDAAVANNNYQYNGKELNEEFGLNLSDYGARWYDAAIGRWWAVDPLASKYSMLSPYSFVANNPLRYIDPDGREIVDPQGRRAIYYDKKGSMHFTKYVTADIRRVAGALSLTTEGSAQLRRINSSDIKTKINISSESKIVTKSAGTHFTYGETIQGNFNEKDNYGKKVNADGTYGIKEATITIYEGTISEGVKDGSGLKHEGLTLEQAIGAVAGHEGVHATDKSEINKDLKAELTGSVRTDKEDKPNQVEQKIIDQSKQLNE